MLFFENGSPNKDIHDALRAAERVRKALREEEAAKIANHAASAEQTDGTERVSAFARRGIDRRVHSAGRATKS